MHHWSKSRQSLVEAWGFARWLKIPRRSGRFVPIGGAELLVTLAALVMLSHQTAPNGGSVRSSPSGTALLDLQGDVAGAVNVGLLESQGAPNDESSGTRGPRKWGALAQLASYVEVPHGGSAEKAMVEYNKWLANGGQALVASLEQKVPRNRAQQEQYLTAWEAWEKIPESQRPKKDFSDPSPYLNR